MKHKMAGDRRSIEGGRIAEIMVYMVLRARAKMAREKVNRPGDSAVMEMIKQHPKDTYNMSRCFQARFMGQEEALRF